MSAARRSLPVFLLLAAPLLPIAGVASAGQPDAPRPSGGGIYEVFFQGDPMWAEQSLGNSDIYPPFESIGRAGCTLTALAMFLVHWGFDTVYLGGQPFPLDPGTLDLFLDVNNLYLPSGFLGFGSRRTGIAWPDIGTISAQLNYTGAQIALEHRLQSWVACGGSPLSATAATYVNHGNDYILPARVDGSAAGCTGHQILLFKYSSLLRKWACLDPASSSVIQDPGRPSYNRLNIVVPAGAPTPAVVAEAGLPLFSGAMVTGSRLSVYAAAGERILIVDSMGRRAGRDASGTWYAEIPGTSEATIDPTDDGSGGKDVVDPGIEGVIVEGALADVYDVQVTDLGGDGHAALVRIEDMANNSRDVSITTPSASLSIGEHVALDDVAVGQDVRLAKGYVVTLSDGPYLLDHDLGSGAWCVLPAGASGTGLFTATGTAVMLSGRRTIDLKYALALQAGIGNSHPQAATDATSAGPAGVTVATADLLANDSDPDLHAIAFAAAGATAETHGTVTLIGDSVKYVPDPGFEGIGRLAYSITDGHGGWAIGRVDVTVSGPTHVRSRAFEGWVERFEVTPNPSRGVATIDFALAREARARLSVLDLAGREVAVLADGAHHSGSHRIAWGGDGSPRPAVGVYFVKLEVADRSWVRRIVVTR